LHHSAKEKSRKAKKIIKALNSFSMGTNSGVSIIQGSVNMLEFLKPNREVPLHTDGPCIFDSS
jgi:hypothetical protein